MKGVTGANEENDDGSNNKNLSNTGGLKHQAKFKNLNKSKISDLVKAKKLDFSKGNFLNKFSYFWSQRNLSLFKNNFYQSINFW